VSRDHAAWAQKADEAEALLRFLLRAYEGRVAPRARVHEHRVLAVHSPNGGRRAGAGRAVERHREDGVRVAHVCKAE